MGRIRIVMMGVVFVMAVPMGTTEADEPNGPTDEQIARALRVQSAMVSGRRLLEQGQFGEAVRYLERSLPAADGNPIYLGLLRDAYTAQLQARTLDQAAPEELERLRSRLRLLDGKDQESELVDSCAECEQPSVAPTPDPAPEKVVAVTTSADISDDPFQQTPLDDLQPSRPTRPAVAEQGVEAFRAKDYRRACELFGRAHQQNEELTKEQLNAWAYSRLSFVVVALNQTEGATPDWNRLAEEISQCQSMTSSAELRRFTEHLAGEIAKRTKSTQPVVRASDPGEKWKTISTTNFQIYHRCNPEVAREVAEFAEQTRSSQFARWGSKRIEDWKPTCTIVLHAGAADFARSTGKSASLPGHARVEQVGQKIRSRRIDLRLDDPLWKEATLPYELAHVVLTDMFIESPLPRWAGEALAVLAQPPGQVARYLRSLSSVRESGAWLSLTHLLNSTDYPDAEHITAFYVQSVSLVDFLIDLKGPQDFLLFLRYGQRYGFEKALERQYGITGFAQLEEAWLAKK